MSAFLDFLSANAIWFYIAGVVVILFGIKLLVDSRREARTTLFTLEQERANDKAFQAILVMILAMIFIGGVLGITTFIAPVRPTPEAATASSTVVAFTPPVILPTFTAVPTLTPQQPTLEPTRTPTLVDATSTPVSVAPTLAPPTSIPVVQTATLTLTPAPVVTYSKPPLNNPTNGEAISRARVQFNFGQSPQFPPQLGPGQFFKVTVSYTNRDTKSLVTRTKCTSRNTLDTRVEWAQLGSDQGAAVDGQFTWSVIIMAVPSGKPEDCDAGSGTAISPPSDTWTFLWN